MLRLSSALLTILAVLATAAPSRADWDYFWYTVDRDYHRNNAWPAPFTHYDMQAVRAPFGVMIAKGWERQNLLGDHHFDESSTALSKAGQMRVRWILTQAPLEHRTIFIENTSTPESLAQRIETVKIAAGDMIPNGDQAAVVVSNMATQGWGADQVDSIGRKWADTTPAPRLPAMEASAEGSGGK